MHTGILVLLDAGNVKRCVFALSYLPLWRRETQLNAFAFFVPVVCRSRGGLCVSDYGSSLRTAR